MDLNLVILISILIVLVLSIILSLLIFKRIKLFFIHLEEHLLSSGFASIEKSVNQKMEQVDRQLESLKSTLMSTLEKSAAQNREQADRKLESMKSTLKEGIAKLENDYVQSSLFVGDKASRASILDQLIRPVKNDWDQPGKHRICLPDSGFTLPGYYGIFSMWFEEFEMLSRYANQGKTYLEVGSLTGATAAYFAKNNRHLKITCIDAFQPGHGTQEGVKAIFLKNMALIPNDGQVTLMEGKAEDLMPTLPEKSFDCILVDGNHSYEAVTQDAVNAYRLVRPFGHILFHDYGFIDEVTQAVDEFIARAGNVTMVEQQTSLLAVLVPDEKKPLWEEK